MEPAFRVRVCGVVTSGVCSLASRPPYETCEIRIMMRSNSRLDRMLSPNVDCDKTSCFVLVDDDS